ncbi:MAG TPA: ABC transporter substrate-binding protein [Rectinemataceae bacterium]|nr:ABC transporter substrate-binding protein [Rectinemataceae bacterium]
MKKGLIGLAIALCLVASMNAQVVKGPIVDKILLNSKSQQDLALQDVAAGRSDLFDYGTDGATYKALPDDVKAKLDPYAVNGAFYIDLYINPYPNQAPYTAKTQDGKVEFNPFAIREVRYAMNFLINRKKIVDEIMDGAGSPMYTPVSEGQPNSSRFTFIAAKLGFTPQGDEKRALADIDTAMKKAAAADPKLAKDGQWWTYDGEPVTIKFLARVDDPTVRVPEAHYIASEIEKAGIKVDVLEYDRAKCTSLWNGTDPASYQWTLYTDAWGGGQTYEFWDTSIAQMYAPWYSFMPGGGKAGQWQYQNKELDSLTQDCVNYRIANSAQYYDKLLKATEMGIREGIRVFIASQTTYTCANKNRFLSRMLYGIGDGVDNYSLYSADVKRGEDGLKTLRVTEFSSKGSLFMSSWDPIGPDGFGDTYSSVVIKNVSDQEYGADPLTGVPFPMTATWSNVKTGKIDFSVTPARGSIHVPENAVLWNAHDQKWESGINYVDVKGDGSDYDYVKVAPGKNVAWSEATFHFNFGRWHDGRRMDINDYRYALARPYDLCIQRSKDDKIYEASYASTINPNLPRIKGYVFNKDNSITVYGDANNPMDKNTLASLLCPTLMIEASNYGDIIPWPIHEALKTMVADGAPSKTTWVFNDNGNFTEVDLLNPTCVADIKATLQKLASEKAVPASLQGYVSPSEAVSAYDKAIAFIDKHGHAVISNGGFVIDQYDPQNNTMVLSAFRDPAYPFPKGWFTKKLSSSFMRVNSVSATPYMRGNPVKINVSLSQVGFPSGIARPATEGRIKVTLVASGEKAFEGKIVTAGSGEATIPASAFANLKPGIYSVVVEASIGSSTDVKSTNIIVF